MSFDTICNLYDASSIVDCYEGDRSLPVPGIKDSEGNWNTAGHPDRLLHITASELKLFAKLFGEEEAWKSAKLPALHCQQLSESLRQYANQRTTLADRGDAIFVTEMWNETGAQKDGTILRNVHFPSAGNDLIYSGPHFSVANPLFKTSRRVCKLNSDYDNIDLSIVSQDYRQRCNYSPLCSPEEYISRTPETPWGTRYTDEYRLVTRTIQRYLREFQSMGILKRIGSDSNGEWIITR